MSEPLHLETIAVNAGLPPLRPDEPLNTPIIPASALGPDGESGYARDGSPGWDSLEEALGALEGGLMTFGSTSNRRWLEASVG
jgi:hypothetical protein